jgi:hypothetical protein
MTQETCSCTVRFFFTCMYVKPFFLALERFSDVWQYAIQSYSEVTHRLAQIMQIALACLTTKSRAQ